MVRNQVRVIWLGSCKNWLSKLLFGNPARLDQLKGVTVFLKAMTREQPPATHRRAFSCGVAAPRPASPRKYGVPTETDSVAALDRGRLNALCLSSILARLVGYFGRRVDRSSVNLAPALAACFYAMGTEWANEDNSPEILWIYQSKRPDREIIR